MATPLLPSGVCLLSGGSNAQHLVPQHLVGFVTCLPTQNLESVPLEGLLYDTEESRWERRFVFASVALTEKPKAFFLPINMCDYFKRLTVLEV